MFSRAAFLGDAVGANLSGGDPWRLLGVLVAGCCLLFVRHRRPLAVLVGELALAVVGSAFGWLPLMYVLPMVALYACAVRGPWRVSVAGSGLYLLGMALALAIDAGISFGPDGIVLSKFAVGGIISNAVISLALIGIAFASHVRWDRRVAAVEERRRETERAAEIERLAAARDAALAKSRIAAELHDSVGHDLTAIIALSEGLAEVTGDEAFDTAVASINELARAGLADTRRAVRALAKDAGEVALEASGPWAPDASDALAGAGALASACNPYHRWDEIPTLLDTARAVGVTAALTETGHRSPDADQADLAFRIVRESVTNALRHAPGLTRITVSVDHGEDGVATVTVRNDGVEVGARGELSALGSADAICEDAVADRKSTGMGLAHLQDLVEVAGGIFSTASDGVGGWTVHAQLDGSSSFAAHANQEGDER